MSNRPITIAIIGGGMMSQVGHIPFFLRNQDCRVKYIVEPRQSIVEYLGREYSYRDCIPHHGAALADPEVEAVVLSAPRPATGPITLECLEAGKHILAEKPMAHSVVQARKLVETADSANLIYGVGFMKRYDPGIVRARQLLDELKNDQRFGALLFANFYNHAKSYAHTPPSHQRPVESRAERYDTWPLAPDWMPDEQIANFAWFMNSASHDINLLHYFFETSPAVINAVQSRNGTVTAAMEHSGAVISFVVTKCEAGKWIQGAEFVFEKGRLLIELPSPMDTGGTARLTLWENAAHPRQHVVETDSGWSFEHQADAFIRALQGSETVATTGAQGLQDMELIETIWKKALQL